MARLPRSAAPRTDSRGDDARPAAATRGPGVRSIRERLVITVFLLTTLALGVSGVVAYWLQNNKIQSAAFAQLARDEALFRDLAAANSNPENNGRPYANARELLGSAMQSKPMSESGGIVAISDQVVIWKAPTSVLIRPENNTEFVAMVIDLSVRPQTTTGRFQKGGVDYAYNVVPIVFAETNERGALVRVIDLNVERQGLNDTFTTYSLVAGGAILAIGGITWLVMARLLQPISWVQRTAEEISEHDITRRIPVRGNDDLAALTNTVNTMLDRLESAVGAQKRLLDDVGHELRTPMTIIRGHLELMDTTDPMDAEVVRALALEELSRMSNLVNDLLVLAQSERSDFVVLQEVDMGRLTDETYEKVRVLGGRPWVMDALADVAVQCDPQRITQAWLQLAANAVKYSPDGSQVGLGSRIDGDNVRLWVRDHGMGFSPDEKDLVLERFGRSRRAGAKRTDSAGLGLAIVNSIAIAHGGRVDIDSIPEVGSTVSLVIPRQPPTETA